MGWKNIYLYYVVFFSLKIADIVPYFALKLYFKNTVSKGQKWSPYENTDDKKKGVTDYAGGSDYVSNEVKRALRKILFVFRLPAYPILCRQRKAFDHLVKSPFTDHGLGLGVGENFFASSHTGFWYLCFSFKNIYHILDNDCCFTFSGSFSNTCDPKGNSFVFPEFKAKIAFEKQLSLFMFNPTFIHCAEKGVFDEGETSYLFRNSSLIKNYHNPKVFFPMTLIQIKCWPYTPNNW